MRCTIYKCGLKTNLVNIPVLMEYVMTLFTMEFVLRNNNISLKNFVQILVSETFSQLFSGAGGDRP